MIVNSVFTSPIGDIYIQTQFDKIIYLWFDSKEEIYSNELDYLHNEIHHQLNAYFLGQLKVFDLPLQMNGSEFSIRVWKELENIPFGETRSYLELAIRLKNKLYTRAVANANKQNPIGIIIPCHRVIASNGSLTGYAGGLWRKEFLLKHEKNNTEIRIGNLF